MSDELDEELVYRAAEDAARKVPLAGRLAGAGPMPADDVEHLGALWWDEQVKPRERRMPMATFVAYVYRCARIREREDARRQEVHRNRRLAENMAAGSDPCDIAQVIAYVRGNAAAHMHVPGPRAAQLADELDRATLSILQLWNVLLRLLTLVDVYQYRYIDARGQDHNDLSDALQIGRGELEWHRLIGVVRYRQLAHVGSKAFDDLLGALGWSRVPAEMVDDTLTRAVAEVARGARALRDLQRLRVMVDEGDTDKAVDTLRCGGTDGCGHWWTSHVPADHIEAGGCTIDECQCRRWR